MGVVILSMDIGMDAIGMDIEELWPAWRPYRPSSLMPMLRKWWRRRVGGWGLWAAPFSRESAVARGSPAWRRRGSVGTAGPGCARRGGAYPPAFAGQGQGQSQGQSQGPEVKGSGSTGPVTAHFEIGASSRWLFSARSPRESTSRSKACQLAAEFSGSAAASSELLKSASSMYSADTGALPRERSFSNTVTSLGAQPTSFSRASNSRWEARLLEGVMSAQWASGLRGADRPAVNVVVAGGVEAAPPG
eukprot:scaffold19419_cov64-Phaeocystis_antarctica.AAC.5